MFEYLKKIVKEICNDNNLEYKFLSKDWIIRITNGSKVAFIVGPSFSINKVTANRIASDKYATYEVLKNANIDVIEHKMIFNKKLRKDLKSDLNSKKEIVNYINSMQNKKIVLKANEGSCGKDVYLCKSYNDFKRNLNKIFKYKASASVCPFYEIDTEYRVICLDNEVKLIYGKKAKDGNWKHNLSQGAEAFKVTDENLKQKLEEIALKAVSEIGLRFASVDIIKCKDRKATYN